MSLPHAQGDPMSPPPPRTVPMPSTPGSPLEPLRPGRRLDRRHWLLAGLLGLVSGAIVLEGVGGQLPGGLAGIVQIPAGFVAILAGQLALGIVGILLAFLLAPGRAVRTLLAVVVLLVGVALALGYSVLSVTGGLGPLQSELGRTVVSAQSILMAAGVVGWALASGGRWWGVLPVLLVPAVAVARYLLLVQGVESGFAELAVRMTCLGIALIALLLTIPRRR